MEKKHIITIAGKPGSGKSTTSHKVAAVLNYNHFSSGDLFREVAKERSLDINEINTVAESEKDIDHAVDERLRTIGENDNKVVIDSRMAWHWMPQSFKVYLDLELHDAATRIIKGMDPARLAVEEIPEDPTAYTKLLQERLNSEIRRYQDLYRANPYDPSNYDLVVDTLNNDPDQVTEIIVTNYREWLST
jgi:cytidylate kinase